MADNSISKAKQAIGSVLSLLSQSKTTSWESRIKLFNSCVLNSISACLGVWGIRYTDNLEQIQISFFKRLLLLPKSTSSALVRLETGTIHIALFVFKVTLNFLLNILSMSPKRLPKICLNRLLALHNSECAYNWVLAIKSDIIDLGHPELWNNLNFTQLKRHKPILLEKLKEKLHQEDLDIALSSSYTVFYTQLTITHDPTNHLNFKIPIYVSRILSQLRLSNNKYCAFHIKGLKYIFRPTEICTVCNNFDFETVEHILIKCPLYKEVRPNSWISLNAIIDILNSLTPGTAKQFCKSFFAILKLRAFLLNE
nr:unnamed protein product [Callosobruchus analis]